MVRRGTYSIVARDPQTGELGAAVQSHWFGVGPIVPWVRPGVGAVATQSIADPGYGPRALDRLQGETHPGARAVLDDLLAADEVARFRQVAIVDASGEVAVHTGEGCIDWAGDQAGEGYSVQANMMASTEVWPAMAHAYEAAAGPLARRLLAALHAAEGRGGDARGRQSAALVVAPAEGEPWRRTVDLRVDDHDDPLGELDRLLDLSDAYALATEGDELTGEGRHDEAAAKYAAASETAPGNHELLFWAGLAAAQTGDLRSGVTRVREAIALHPGWADLLERLTPEIAPSAEAVRQALAVRG
ncbi:MAG: DUF1028 domain-containing protein [Solirubrobacteraceae bacterium]